MFTTTSLLGSLITSDTQGFNSVQFRRALEDAWDGREYRFCLKGSHSRWKINHSLNVNAMIKRFPRGMADFSIRKKHFLRSQNLQNYQFLNSTSISQFSIFESHFSTSAFLQPPIWKRADAQFKNLLKNSQSTANRLVMDSQFSISISCFIHQYESQIPKVLGPM